MKDDLPPRLTETSLRDCERRLKVAVTNHTEMQASLQAENKRLSAAHAKLEYDNHLMAEHYKEWQAERDALRAKLDALSSTPQIIATLEARIAKLVEEVERLTNQNMLREQQDYEEANALRAENERLNDLNGELALTIGAENLRLREALEKIIRQVERGRVK